VIHVEQLRKVYGPVTAVDGLSFDVPGGQVLGLVGPNGAGKTTTLRALAGIIRPTGGRIRIAGIPLDERPTDAKRLLAFIPDEPQLFEYLTVEEHLRFVARVYNVADADGRIPPLLAELELDGKRAAFPSELSRGMKQKLATACGLLHDPRVLILDEPLTGLDPAAIRRMKGTILARARAGATVILSSHLLTLVEELCSRVLVLQHGRAVALGTIAEIVAERPELAGRPLEDVFLALTGQTEEMAVAEGPPAALPVPGPDGAR
jgi:ABC-2 type transport system ATP-binding protein